MNFEILRDMESFTQDMFNRIIAFQEKEHSAWNTQLSFKQRIKGLPLHYLIFSNPDRDPQTQGPTVAHFYPLKNEMATFARYIRQISPKAVVCDAHARNGFLGTLLALENINVFGLRDPTENPNQIQDFFDSKIYDLQTGTLNQLNTPIDVLFSAWMPSSIDITQEIIQRQPKLVIYIYSKHKAENTGEPQTGITGAFGDRLSKNYKLIDEWSISLPKNLFHDLWPDLTPNPQEVRHVRIYADEPYHQLTVKLSTAQANPYPWERDLMMAKTALKAKEQLSKQGFPTNDF